MLSLIEHNKTVTPIIPCETRYNCCFVETPKQMFLALMSGERVCFKKYNMAARYYLRAVEIFKQLYIEGISDFEFVRRLNNYIVQNIAYDHDVVNKEYLQGEDWDSYEIDAPLFKSKGVCAAKSKFFSLLCSMANIKNVLVTGSLKAIPKENRHAWNKVFLQKPNGILKWHNIDVTNNHSHYIPERFVDNDYFLIPDKQISKTHTFLEYDETHEYMMINYVSSGTTKYPTAI